MPKAAELYDELKARWLAGIRADDPALAALVADYASGPGPAAADRLAAILRHVYGDVDVDVDGGSARIVPDGRSGAGPRGNGPPRRRPG